MRAHRQAAGEVAGEETDPRARDVSGKGSEMIAKASQAGGAGPACTGSGMWSGRTHDRTASGDHARRAKAASARSRNVRTIGAARHIIPSVATSASRPAGVSRGVRGEGAGAAPARDWAAACCRRRTVRRTSPRRPCWRGRTAPRPGRHSRRRRAAATLRGAPRAARVSLGRSRHRGGRRQARLDRCRASRPRAPRGSRSALRAPRSRAAALHSMPARRAARRSRAPATRAATPRCPAGSDGATGRSASVAGLPWDSRERV